MQIIEKNPTTIAQPGGKDEIYFFRTTGFSMRPFLKGEEKIVVKRTRTEDLRVGDIIVYESNYLRRIVCHRLARKVERENGFLLYTRGDANPEADRPIGEEVLIGRVVAVLSGRRVVDLTGRWRSLTKFLIVRIYPSIRVILKMGRKIASFIWRLLQQTIVYYKIANSLFYRKVDCREVKSKEENDKYFQFYQPGIPFDLGKDHTVSGDEMPSLHRFMATYKDKVIGVATLIEAEDKSPYQGFWVHGFKILLRFGGAGIEQKLMRAIEDFTLAGGGSKLNLVVENDGILTRRLYEKQGFEKIGERKVRFYANAIPLAESTPSSIEGLKTDFKSYLLMQKRVQKHQSN